MKKIYDNTNNGINTEQFLSNLYMENKKELHQQAKLGVEDMKAKKLEAFLNLVKSVQKNNGDISQGEFSRFWTKAEQITLLNELQKVYNGNGAFFENLLGLTSSNPNELGNALEHGMARIIKTFEAKITGINYKDTKVHNVGGMQTNIPDLVDIGKDVVKQSFNKMYSTAAQNLREYKGKKGTGISYSPQVQGKIDIEGLYGDLQVSLNGQLEADIYDALSNASFTLKNYISTSDLKLGQTNPFRVFATVAQNSGEDIIYRYVRMYNCFKGHSGNEHPMAPIYFYRLRAMYELTGSKMAYTNTNNALSQILSGQYAKFLIWNNPNGNIRVISTMRIIKSIFDAADFALPNNWKDALFSPIILPQTSLEDI